MTGCVSNKKYAALQAEHDALRQDYTTLQMDKAKSEANGQSLETLLAEARRNNAEAQAELCQSAEVA